MKDNLLALLAAFKETVQSYLTQDTLRLHTIPFVRSQCVRVDYGPTGISGNSSQIFYFEKQLVHPNDVQRMIQESSTLSTNFLQTTEIMQAQTGMHPGQTIVDLYNFLTIVINEKFTNTAYNSEVENVLIDDFVQYVLSTPIPHKIQIWISTLILKTADSFIDNEEYFYIRKPVPSDYHIDEQLAIGGRLESNAPGMCSAIIETEVIKFWPELHEWESYCGKVINALRLFSNNPIVVLRVKTSSVSKFQHSFDFRPAQWPFPTPLFSHFTNARLVNFREFYQYIQPYIGSDTSTILDDGQTPHPFDIGFHWYNVALTSRISTNGKIAALISCLEALYAIENFEAKYRLSQYCAFHLGFYGQNTLMITTDINKSYTIRSQYYHGGDVRSNPDTTSRALLNRMLHYCKISLSLLLPLKGTVNRTELLKLFPKAIIDVHSKQELIKKFEPSQLFQY